MREVREGAGESWQGCPTQATEHKMSQPFISSGNLPKAEPNCSLPLPHQPFPSHQSQEIAELRASRSLSRSSGYAQGVQWWPIPTLVHS